MVLLVRRGGRLDESLRTSAAVPHMNLGGAGASRVQCQASAQLKQALGAGQALRFAGCRAISVLPKFALRRAYVRVACDGSSRSRSPDWLRRFLRLDAIESATLSRP